MTKQTPHETNDVHTWITAMDCAFRVRYKFELYVCPNIPSKHVYMGPIWAESGHLSHSGPAWAPYRLFCPYKTYIGPILVNVDQQTRIYGNHMGRFGAFIPFGS